jgi:hypothetical protein
VHAKELCDRHGFDVDFGSIEFIQQLVSERRAGWKVLLPPEYSIDFQSTDASLDAFDYLHHDRMLPRTVIAGYQIGHCPHGEYGGRVVIPVIEDGELATFVARDYTGHASPEKKYLSARKPVPHAMFNLDRAGHRGGVLVLVEGIFDALRLPEFAVALLGKGWSAEKRERVLRKKPSVVFIALDQDGSAEREQQEILEDLWGLVPHVAPLRIAGKDLGAASRAVVADLNVLLRETARAARPRPAGTVDPT